jgi:hypothetical protein
MTQNASTFSIILIALIGCAASTCGFAPGIMPPDAIHIFNNAQALKFDDWHMPTTQAIWAMMHQIIPGPLGMLLLIQVCYWLGFALIGVGLARRAYRVLGLAVVLLGTFPPSIHMTSIVLVDTLMVAFFLPAVGLMVLSTTSPWRVTSLVGAAIFICLGTAMRPNAFAATFPLVAFWLLCLRPEKTLTWRSWGVSAVAAVCLFIAITQVERAVLNPERTNVERSLMIFDLGGITYFSGKDQFKDIMGADFVERNALSCYHSAAWNVYRWGKCKDVDATVIALWTPIELAKRWSSAIIHHPLAYAHHRLKHFWQLLSNRANFTALEVQRVWGGLPFTPSAIYAFVEARASALYASSIWQPYVWCLLLFATLASTCLSHDRFMSLLLICLASSGLTYMAFYALVGVAADWRYGYWTQVVTTICLTLSGAVVASLKSVAKARYRINMWAAPHGTKKAIYGRDSSNT